MKQGKEERGRGGGRGEEGEERGRKGKVEEGGREREQAILCNTVLLEAIAIRCTHVLYMYMVISG